MKKAKTKPRQKPTWDGTICPCKGKKERETMLCPACVESFKDRRELREYQDTTLPVDYRRSAAVILLSLARKRTDQHQPPSLPLAFSIT